MSNRRLVILESPYAGEDEAHPDYLGSSGRNIEYARACVRDSLERGEAPIASHLLYTQKGILNDKVPDERKWGIEAGLEWCFVADAAVVYIDLGVSKGMQQGMARHRERGLDVDIRRLNGKWS